MGGPLLVILLMVTPAMAQDRIELKGVVGTTGFLDSPTNYHPAVGGAVRVRMSGAFSVESSTCAGPPTTKTMRSRRPSSGSSGVGPACARI